MPHSTKWEPRGVVWKFTGHVSGAELLTSNREIYGDERFDRMSYQIVDLTEVERFDVSEEDMLVVAANDRGASRSRQDVRVAIATRDEMIRQRCEFYDEVAGDSPWKQEIFETVDEARSWIKAEMREKRRVES